MNGKASLTGSFRLFRLFRLFRILSGLIHNCYFFGKANAT